MTPTSARERIDAAIDRLRLDGERVTKARTALIEILADSDDHLCADDIAELLEGDASSTHRATVYRTLESLVKAGIVAHVHLPHGAARYHLIDTERAHLHLLCRDCGDIIDAPPDLLDEVRQRLDASTGFRLDPDHVALTGWCRSCRPDIDA